MNLKKVYMNIIYPGFSESYLAYDQNQTVLPPYTDEIGLLAQNMIIGPFVSRITLRKHKMDDIVTAEVDV